MLGHMAVSAKRHQIPKRIIPQLTSFDLMMDLQVLE